MSRLFCEARVMPFCGIDVSRVGVSVRFLSKLAEWSVRLCLWTLRRLPLPCRVRGLRVYLGTLEDEHQYLADHILSKAAEAGFDESDHENDPSIAADLIEFRNWFDRKHHRVGANSSTMPGARLVPGLV